MIRYQINAAGDIFDIMIRQDVGTYHKGRLSVDFFKVENFNALGLDIDEWLKANNISPRTNSVSSEYVGPYDMVPSLVIRKETDGDEHRVAGLLTLISRDLVKFEATFSIESFDELRSAIDQRRGVIISTHRLLRVNSHEVYEHLECETQFESDSLVLTFRYDGKSVHSFNATSDAIDKFLVGCRDFESVRVSLRDKLGVH